MGKREDAPFARGTTWFNGDFIPSSVPAGEFMSGFNIEGEEFEWEDSQLPNGGYGTGLTVRCRVVRNSASYNILPGQLVTFTETRYGDNSTVLYGTNVGGVAATEAAYAFPADEFLPAGGVPPGDLFYIVVNGPCLLTTAKTPPSGNVNIAIGQKVVSCSGSATTDGDEGAIIAQDTTQTGANLFNQIQNGIGRALSATTTGQTGTQTLVAIGW